MESKHNLESDIECKKKLLSELKEYAICAKARGDSEKVSDLVVEMIDISDELLILEKELRILQFKLKKKEVKEDDN